MQGLTAEPEPLVDRAYRGLRHLESYELGLDRADLDAALDHLIFATEQGADHPDRPFWCFARAIAHAYRSGDDSPDELDTAIGWCETAFAETPVTDRGQIAVVLGDLYWTRYADARSDPDAARHLDGLIELLGAVQVDDADPLVTANLSMMLGAAYAERSESSQRREDLDAAIARLEPAVDVLPADVPDLAAGALLLCAAYRSRGRVDDDPHDLDRAIALADRTAARLDPVAEPRVVNLRWTQYLYLCERLERTDDHLDRDEAIRCLRHAAELSQDPDPELAMALAELLGDRGELYQDTDDLASAAGWAGVAANAETDTEHGWYPRLWQADAYLARYVETEDLDDLKRLVDALTGAIDAGLPDADLRLMAARDRLKAQFELDKHRVRAGQTTELEAATRRAPLVTAADEALRTEPDGDTEIRSDLAGVLLGQWLALAGDDVLRIDVDHLRELLALARSHPPDPHRAQLLAICEGAIGIHELDGGSGDYGMTSLSEALAMPEFDASTTSELHRMMSVAKLARGTRTGDLRDLDSAVSGLYRAGRDSGGPLGGRQHELFETFASITRTGAGGDHAQLQANLDRAADLLAEGDSASPTDRMLGAALGLARMVRQGAGPAEIAAFVDSLPSGPTASGGVFGYYLAQAVRVMGAMAGVLVAYHQGTPAERAGSAQTFVRAVDAVSAGHPMREALLVISVGQALDLLERHADPLIEEAVQRWTQQSTAGCRHPADQFWAPAWFNLARAHRRRGGTADLARARADALTALRGRTWQVVLQFDADYGVQAARRRSYDVRVTAQWCRADAETADPDDRQPILAQLVQALDAGRGMVLGTATAAGAVHEALVACGEADLAARWLAGERFDNPDPQFEVADLRHRVVAALARGTAGSDTSGSDGAASGGADLFAPVTVNDIRTALTASGRDALVYLVASDTAEPGYALTVTAAGHIDLLALPALRVHDSPLGWYLHTSYGAQVLAGGDSEAWRWSLSQLSTWAWRAGMGAVVAHCSGLVADGVPRLVLVPTGALAAVPWHAAWRLVDGAERRYAVQDLSVSYAASARTWCDSIGRAPVGAGPALVVADPTGDLPSAADEADSIRRAFYPDATYLGRLPTHSAAGAVDGDGTPDEVLTWLAAADAAPAAVVHAACHGIVETDRPTQSHLRLAGGALRADDLVRLAVRHRRTGTVVLAACTTHVTVGEYDEALTLSTAFLVAGAASVVGSLWAVPSASTGLLMYMFHHYLREQPGDPGEALRRAQLWMLDPRRQVPAGAAALAGQVDPDRLADPYRWAGFAHLGR